MNYAELKTKVIDQSHRKDMATRVPGFIDDARTRINLRLGLELVPFTSETETNDVLDQWPLIYFYAAMVQLYLFIIELETANNFDQLYRAEVDRYYITRKGTEPLVITPEGPTP